MEEQMTREKAIEMLREISRSEDRDPEAEHTAADQVLCDLLTAMGFADVVAEYEKIHKYYA